MTNGKRWIAAAMWLLGACGTDPSSAGGDTSATESAGEDGPVGPCADAYAECDDSETDCVTSYVACREPDGCEGIVTACAEIGAAEHCAATWPDCYDGSSGDAGADDAGDEAGADDAGADEAGADEAGTDAGADEAGADEAGADEAGADEAGDAGDTGGGACSPSSCNGYASKMKSCYPSLSVDWYADCLDIYDICDIGGTCFDGVPGTVSCINSTPCEQIVDGACNGLDETC